MDLTDKPDKLVIPFANSGGRNTIPVDSQIGIIGGKASLTDGFPPLTRIPKDVGGIPPFGLDANGILYEMSASDRWSQAGAGYPFDGTFANNSLVNGYPQGARVMRSDGMGYWLNTVDGNITDPESAGSAAAGWVPDFTNGVAAIAMTSSNVTLTPVQYGKPVILITGLLTTNLNLIFPPIEGQWGIINNTTGNFTITAKTASGTGVPVGSSQFIMGDGVNIYSSFSQSKLPGDVVQTVYFLNANYNTITAITPFDDTIPQISEGTQVLIASITAASTANILEFDVTLCGELVSSVGTELLIGSLFKDSDANAIATTFGSSVVPAGIAFGQLNFNFKIAAGDTSAHSYSFRLGVTSGTATFYINGSSSGRKLGGTSSSYMQITEKKV